METEKTNQNYKEKTTEIPPDYFLKQAMYTYINIYTYIHTNLLSSYKM